MYLYALFDVVKNDQSVVADVVDDDSSVVADVVDDGSSVVAEGAKDGGYEILVLKCISNVLVMSDFIVVVMYDEISGSKCSPSRSRISCIQ